MTRQVTLTFAVSSIPHTIRALHFHFHARSDDSVKSPRFLLMGVHTQRHRIVDLRKLDSSCFSSARKFTSTERVLHESQYCQASRLDSQQICWGCSFLLLVDSTRDPLSTNSCFFSICSSRVFFSSAAVDPLADDARTSSPTAP